MGNFHSTFYSIGDPIDFSSAKWQKYFIPFDHEAWAENLGGVIQYFDDDRIFSLIFEFGGGERLSLRYDLHGSSKASENFAFVSVEDAQQMNFFEETDNGSMIPVGSFLSPILAWEAFEQFVSEPTCKPDAIVWMNCQDLNWPQ